MMSYIARQVFSLALSYGFPPKWCRPGRTGVRAYTEVSDGETDD